jgi:hypothetical protein
LGDGPRPKLDLEPDAVRHLDHTIEIGPDATVFLDGPATVQDHHAAPIPARPAGAIVALPVEHRHILKMRRDAAEYFSEERLKVERELLLRFGDSDSGPRE